MNLKVIYKIILKLHEDHIQYQPLEKAQALLTRPSLSAISTDMHDSPAVHKLGQHLSDIQIAFVLMFDKVKITQHKIASLIKCSRQAVRTALANYTFDTFKGHKPCRNYKGITTKE